MCYYIKHRKIKTRLRTTLIIKYLLESFTFGESKVSKNY